MSIQNIRRSVLIAVAAGALAVGGLFAGRLVAGALPGDGSGHGPRNVFTRIARALDLTDEQQAKAREILRSHVTEIEAQLHAAASARQALHEAMQAQPMDENTIRDRARDLGRVHGDGAVLIARIRTEIEPILTADQKTRLQTLRDKMRSRGDHAAHALHEFLDSEAP